MLPLVPLVLCFVFMITAWVYWLRGWLVTLMLDKRRRRAIVVYAVLGIVLLGQLPNLLNLFVFQPARAARQKPRYTVSTPASGPAGYSATNQPAAERKDAVPTHDSPRVVTTLHTVVPILWLANGARGLAERDLAPAVLGAAGSVLLGMVALRLGYRSTVRFYRGESRRAIAPALPEDRPVRKARERDLLALRIWFLPDDVVALAAAQRRAMARAPEIKMLLPMNAVIGLGLFGMILFGAKFRIPDAAAPFIATGVIGWAFYGLTQVFCNQFGYDRDGFRTLVLLPTPRQEVLLGKNLALLPLAGLMAAVFLLGVTLLARLPSLVVAAAPFGFVTLFVLFSVFGNLASILLPYRVAPGSLKPTKLSPSKVIAITVLQILTALVILPALIPAALGLLSQRIGLLDAQVVNLLGSVGLAILALWLYRITLPPLGQLLRKRETQILQAVTTAPE